MFKQLALLFTFLHFALAALNVTFPKDGSMVRAVFNITTQYIWTKEDEGLHFIDSVLMLTSYDTSSTVWGPIHTNLASSTYDIPRQNQGLYILSMSTNFQNISNGERLVKDTHLQFVIADDKAVTDWENQVFENPALNQTDSDDQSDSTSPVQTPSPTAESASSAAGSLKVNIDSLLVTIVATLFLLL